MLLRYMLHSEFRHSTMPQKFGGKWGTERLNNRFPLPTLLCAGYSVKLNKKNATMKKKTEKSTSFSNKQKLIHLYFKQTTKEQSVRYNQLVIRSLTQHSLYGQYCTSAAVTPSPYVRLHIRWAIDNG